MTRHRPPAVPVRPFARWRRLRSGPLALVAALALLVVGAGGIRAQEPEVRYDVRFDGARHHEARIAATFPAAGSGSLEVVMSRASPGRYALHEFAKNVYDVEAVDGDGERLAVERLTPHRWRIAGADGPVTVRYTLYADRADGTYAAVDPTHAHLNMPATFLWAPEHRDLPHVVTFHPPEGAAWRAATQLPRAGDGLTFRAPDLAYFMDSPTELSDFDLRTWEAGSGDRTATIRLAVHHRGTDAELDAYAADVKRVVDELIAVFGRLPELDHGTYTFIADYLPYVDGDGMEHRNSTILTSTRPLSTGADANLGTVAHEFVHTWNMERLRADALEPFDFLRANMSSELWFGEGFTSYYDELVRKRAGLISLERYLDGLAGALNRTLQAPGRRLRGPAAMSRQAPFVDAATSIDPTNHANTFLSYYTYGWVLGAGLDLELRSRFDTTLDAYMRAAWDELGEPETPYTHEDLERVLARVTGDPGFAEGFFERSVEGSELMDFESLLAEAGLLLRPANPDRPVFAPERLAFTDDGARIASNARVGSPLYRAGLDRGDILLEVAGRTPSSEDALEAALDGRGPGDTVRVRYRGRRGTEKADVVLAADPDLEIVPYEEAGREVAGEARTFREGWLETKVGGS